MRRVAFLAGVLVLLALDFAALDDITTGSESDFLGEYLTLGLSAVTLFVTLIYRKSIAKFLR